MIFLDLWCLCNWLLFIGLLLLLFILNYLQKLHRIGRNLGCYSRDLWSRQLNSLGYWLDLVWTHDGAWHFLHLLTFNWHLHLLLTPQKNRSNKRRCLLRQRTLFYKRSLLLNASWSLWFGVWRVCCVETFLLLSRRRLLETCSILFSRSIFNFWVIWLQIVWVLLCRRWRR